MPKSVRVTVPASTANLGPGYDVLGLALKHYNVVEASWEPSAGRSSFSFEIEARGEGAESLPRDRRNIVLQSMLKTFQAKRVSLAGRRLRIRLTNRIPLARGMGSSAAARLGAVLAADALAGPRLSRAEVLNLATALEGHPDNVAPSLLGGLCISLVEKEGVRCVRLDPPRDLTAVVCVPEFELSTAKARALLPKSVPHEDAVFNVARVALFLGALARRDYAFLATAMQDRLHQSYRKELVPGFDRVLSGARRAGAYGAALSGAGPSMLALAPRPKVRAVARAMERGFAQAGKRAKCLALDFDRKGARVETGR